MCFNAETSLVTFLVGMISSIFVINLGTGFDKIVGLFGAYISLMQGIEFALWRHQVCDDYHRSISVLGSVLTGGQPIILGILALIFSNRNKTYIFGILLFLAMYGLWMHIFTTPLPRELQCTHPTPGDPHLVWNWGSNFPWSRAWIIYIVSIVSISILGMPTLMQSIGFTTILLLSMLITAAIYPRNDVGALWCFIGALLPPVYYYLRVVNIIKI